jgi:DNA-binding XRE family transcriptional regulator
MTVGDWTTDQLASANEKASGRGDGGILQPVRMLSEEVLHVLAAQVVQEDPVVRCRRRSIIVRSVHRHWVGGQNAWCKACLAKDPDAGIGARLKTYRITADIIRQDLASRIGLSNRQLAEIELERVHPSWRTLDKLLLFFGSELLPVYKAQSNSRVSTA